MMKKGFVGSALVTLMLAANAASADVIFNTGNPDNTGSQVLVDSADWLAGQVTFNHDYQINSIQAYLDELFPGAGNGFTVKLYSNTTSNKVGTQLIFSDGSSASRDGTFAGTGWNGVGVSTPLNWTVTSGTYWIALEVSDAQGSNLVAGQYATGNPFTRTATATGNGYTIDTSAYQFGLQIDATPVPEPTSIALMLAGLGLVGAARRRNA